MSGSVRSASAGTRRHRRTAQKGSEALGLNPLLDSLKRDQGAKAGTAVKRFDEPLPGPRYRH
jgi:hypothetical protein